MHLDAKCHCLDHEAGLSSQVVSKRAIWLSHVLSLRLGGSTFAPPEICAMLRRYLKEGRKVIDLPKGTASCWKGEKGWVTDELKPDSCQFHGRELEMCHWT